MSGKRTYGQYNAERMVGGRKLRYVAKAPVAYSSRWYNTGAARSVGMQTAVARAVRGVAEKKGVDTALTATGVLSTTNTNGDSFVLNLIQMGSGSWNRIGRKVNLQSIRLRGILTYLFSPAAVTLNLSANTVRMVVVWDRQPSGAAIPAFDQIFGTTTQTGTEACLFLDPLRYDNTDRYTVLRDVVKTASPMTTQVGGSANQITVQCPFDEYIKLGGRETVFSGQSNPMTIADISTGALYVYFRADSVAAASASQWNVDSDSFARLRYTDI